MRRNSFTMILVLAIAGVACANATPTSPGAGARVPTGADQIVLQIGYEGGYVAPSYLFTNTPFFSLYGDGALIEPGAQTEIYPGQALPPLLQRTLSAEAIAAVVQRALDAGLDHDTSYTDMGSVMIADAADTVFTLQFDGQIHSVRVYALGELGGEQPHGMPDTEWAARRALSKLTQDVQTLSDWIPAGSIGESSPYAGTGARLLVGDYQADDTLPQDPIAWPLATSLDSVGEPTSFDPHTRCVVVNGSDWTSVHDLATGANQLTPWTSDGHRFAVAFRPLLPDEAPACPAA